MSADAARFLNGFAQAISTMGLYAEGHPARERVIDTSFGLLRRLQEKDPTPQFSFLGLDVIYGQVALRELKEWDWGLRLAEAGVQRLEFAADTGRDEYEAFLGDVLARLIPQAIDSSTRSPERRSTIKFGAIGVKGSEGVMRPEELLRMVTVNPARALRRRGQLGKIAPGALADLIALPAPGTLGGVYEDIINHDKPVTWTMIDGQICA